MKKGMVWLGLFAIISASLFDCGGGKGGVDEVGNEVNPPDATETYTVTGAQTWSLSGDGSGSDTLVFSKTGDELSWVDYDNTNGIGISYFIWSRVLLRYPVTEGDTWSESGGSNGYTIETTTVVEDTDAEMTVDAGTFTSCVVTRETFSVDSTYNSGSYIAQYRKFYAPGVGLVKVQDTWHTGEVSTGVLIDYRVHDPDPGDYFPLAAGDWWKFEWTTE
jgi:hypothetical protein